MHSSNQFIWGEKTIQKKSKFATICISKYFTVLKFFSAFSSKGKYIFKGAVMQLNDTTGMFSLKSLLKIQMVAFIAQLAQNLWGPLLTVISEHKIFVYGYKQKINIGNFLVSKNDISLKMSGNVTLNEWNNLVKFHIHILCRFKDISSIYFFVYKHKQTFCAHVLRL